MYYFVMGMITVQLAGLKFERFWFNQTSSKSVDDFRWKQS